MLGSISVTIPICTIRLEENSNASIYCTVLNGEGQRKHTVFTHFLLLDTYMRCVESGVQSGRYLAPMSRAFSLSSPLKGFWKPLRTNTTPSMIRLNGTDCTVWDLAFCGLGLGSALGWLSRFFSADFCAGEAGGTICESQESFPDEEIIRKLSDLS